MHSCFVHHQGSDQSTHSRSPETVDHTLSKLALLDWIKRKYGDKVVKWDCDSKNITHHSLQGDRQIRPDVFVEFATGARLAIEVQHSRPKLPRMREKTRAYKEMQIAVWWMFSGQSESTFLDPRPCPPVEQVGSHTVALMSEQQALLGEGATFFWFNQPSLQVATPVIWRKEWLHRLEGESWGGQLSRDLGYFVFAPTRRDVRARPWVHDLSECEINLETGELVTPGTLRVMRDEKLREKMEDQGRDKARSRHANMEKRLRSRAEQAEPLQEVESMQVRPEGEPVAVPSPVEEGGDSDVQEPENTASRVVLAPQMVSVPEVSESDSLPDVQSPFGKIGLLQKVKRFLFDFIKS
ncbi:MAG: hypothetical protein Q4D96_11730 [Propionibacteriaceae bacterium]|nr:hypothetical protein [Propionibacteriaceae bacterium]